LAVDVRRWLIRGDVGFGNEPVMREAEQRHQPYLFKLRLTKGVKRAIERAMDEQDWHNAGASWQGKDGEAYPVRDKPQDGRFAAPARWSRRGGTSFGPAIHKEAYVNRPFPARRR
jgi:hypothetical protein